MKKLIFAVVVSLAILSYSGTALSSEQITVTTYYPSPNGAYNQLLANDFTTNKANFNPYPNLGSVPSPREGTLVYIDANTSDSTPGQFWYYGGGGWVQQSGGGGSYVAWGTSDCASGWSRAYSGVMMVATLSRTDVWPNTPAQDVGLGISNIVCSATNLGDGQSHTGGARIYFRTHSVWPGGDSWSRGPIACSLCVK